MFIEKTEVCNFADDNTIYDCGEDLSNILENLKHDIKILIPIHDVREEKTKFGRINNKFNRN